MTNSLATPTKLANLPEVPLADGGHPILGHIDNLQKDPLNFYLNMHRRYGDLVRMRSGPWSWVAIRHPDHLKHVLQDNNTNYHKGIFYEELRLLVGNGLITSDGDFWLRQRRLAQPAFHRHKIASFADTMVNYTGDMLDRWQAHPADQPLDIHHEMMALTLRIVGQALFGSDVSSQASEIGDAVTYALDFINDRGTRILNAPMAAPLPAHQKFKQATNRLDTVIQRLIDTRRRTGDLGDDLLTMLLHARDEDTQAQMTDQQLRDEAMTIFLAGHETTANLLTWAFYLLSVHPTVRQKLEAEIADVLGGRPPTFADLPNLRYTRMVIDETLRLYPTAWLISRTATHDDAIGGYRIPANTPISMSIFITHRDPRWWPNPEGFDPERFAPETDDSRPRFAYLPFGGGPRLCIGNNFAIIEAQIVMAMLTQRFQLNAVPGYLPVPEPAVTLRPRYGMPMQLVARQN